MIAISRSFSACTSSFFLHHLFHTSISITNACSLRLSFHEAHVRGFSTSLLIARAVALRIFSSSHHCQ